MYRCGVTMLAFALGGCASFSQIGENYSALQPQSVTTEAGTWQVIDRAAEGKILVQRNPGRGTAGAVSSLGANPANAASPQPDHQEAAAAFLAQTGRKCTIKDGYLVVAPSWEFAYECTGAPAAATAPK